MTRIEDYIRNLKPGIQKVRIPKNLITEWSPGWEESLINMPEPGSLASYRKGRIHLHEMDDCYAVHIDRKDPKKDPLGHLAEDAPEVLVGVGVGLFLTALLIYAISKSGSNQKS